jgi:flagellar protein FliS
MLYDGAIATLHRAVAAIKAHDIETKCKQLNRALAIIVQLEGSLNFELGGEVAQTLKSFYEYARAQIMKANIENSLEILRSLIEQFASVREAWHQADHPSPSTPPATEGEEPRRNPPQASESHSLHFMA